MDANTLYILAIGAVLIGATLLNNWVANHRDDAAKSRRGTSLSDGM